MATKIEIAADHIWLEVYLACVEDRIIWENYLPVSELGTRFPALGICGITSRNITSLGLEHLASLGHIEKRYVQREEADCLRLTAGGFGRAEIALADSDSSLSAALTYRSQRLPSGIEALQAEAPLAEDIGGDDKGVWEPLKIDRGSKSYEEAMESLQAAYETIRNDNGFSVAEPELRNSIVDSLQTGIEVLEKKTPTRGVIKALLLRPLAFMIERFSGAILGEAAKTAWRKVIDWLLSSFGGTWS